MALMVILHPENESPIVHAIDLSQEWRITLDAAEDQTVEVDAFLYDCPLGSLGLVAGEIQVDPEGRPIPAPTRIFSSTIEEETEWLPVATPPDRTVAIRLPTDPSLLCSGFDLTEVVIEGNTESPRVVEPLDRDTVLLGLRDGSMYLVSIDGAITPIAPPPNRRYVGSIRMTGQQPLLFSEEGCVARFEQDQTFTEIGCAGIPPTGWAFTTATFGPPLQALALYEDGDLVMTDGSTVTVVPTSRKTDVGKKGGIHALGPDDVLIGGLLEFEVLRVTGGTEILESVPIQAFDKVNGVFDTQLGTLSLANMGDIFVRNEESTEWSLVVRSGVPQTRLAADFGDGVLVSGISLTAELRPSGAICEPVTLLGGGEARRMITFEGRTFVAGDPDDTDARVVFVDPIPPAFVCGQM